MSKTKKNFLLLFLSKDKKAPSQYRISNQKETISTEHSNESAVYELNALLKQNNECIDKVFVFISQAAQSKSDNGLTTLEFFQNRIKEIAAPENVLPIQYDENKSMNEALSDIGKMGERIMAEITPSDLHEADITVHADMTGGMRNASMMMLGLMRLLDFSKLKIGKVFYSNWEKNREYNFVEDSGNVYRLFDLVAGATEFAGYGSVDKLIEYYNMQADVDAYFDEADFNVDAHYQAEKYHISKQLYELLLAMAFFAQSIKLCRYGEFEEACQRLKEKIDAFADKNNTADGSKPNDKIFATLLPTIKESYQKILGEHDDLDIITWCVEQGYLQQAMTLYTERVPEFVAANKFYELAPEIKEDICKKVKKEEITENNYVLCRLDSDADSNWDDRENLEDFLKNISKKLKNMMQDFWQAKDKMRKNIKSMSKEEVEQKNAALLAEMAARFYVIENDIRAKNMFLTADKEDFVQALKELPQVYGKKIILKNLSPASQGIRGMIYRYFALDSADKKILEASSAKILAEWRDKIPQVEAIELCKVFGIGTQSYYDKFRGYILGRGIDKKKLICNLAAKEALINIIDTYTKIRHARNSSNHARHEKGYTAKEIEAMIIKGVAELREANEYVKNNSCQGN